jgi:hypothetical protein
VKHDASGATLHALRLPLTVSHSGQPVTVHVEPLVGYADTIRRLAVTRGVAVTCELEVSLPRPDFAVEALVTDLCLLMSVARGTKVQWVYRTDFASDGRAISTTHFSRVTRPFHVLEVLRAAHENRHDTKRFLERGLSALNAAAAMYEVRRGLIDAYIDSRDERDFLEMRGVKVAVVAEMVKAAHTRYAAFQVASAAYWQRLIRALVARARPRRRVRFGEALRAACNAAGFRPKRSELRKFVIARNTLIHEGTFWTTAIHPAAPSPFTDATNEYFFLVSFLDRFFLKLLGYSGSFIDWSAHPHQLNGNIS